MSGTATLEPAAPLTTHPREPEQLPLPGAAVQELIALALRTETGATAWRFFALAHGAPSWLAPGRFRVVVNDASLLPVPPVGEED